MTTPNNPKDPLPRAAIALVATRGICGLGSTLTSFGLNVWVYRETGSYATFALLAVLASIPEIVFAPFAGLIADRFHQKRLLLACDLISLAMVFMVWLLYDQGLLSVAAVAATVTVLSLAAVMRWSVLSPVVARLVPAHQLSRINGLQESFRGINLMFGPVLGSAGLGALGLPLLLGLDLIAYMIGIAALLWLRLPPINPQGLAGPAFKSFQEEVTYGFRWVFGHRPLRRLLLFFMVINIGISVFTATFAPYVLSFASSTTLGLALAMEGAGGFAIGLLLARRQPHSRHDIAILGGAATIGVCMFAWGLSRNAALIFLVALVWGGTVSILMAASQTIWQLHVPVAVQGKVFAVRMVVAYGLAPLSILLSVPFAEFFFSPALSVIPWAARLWGAPPTGHLGLMVSTLGVGVSVYALLLASRGGFSLGEAPAREAAHVPT